MPSFQIVPPGRLNTIGDSLVAGHAFDPVGDVTKCNLFLSEFVRQAFDYHGFDALSANGSWASAGLPDRLPQIARAGERVFCGEHLGFGISPESFRAGELVVSVRRA